MSPSLASRLLRFERASTFYLVLAYALASGLLAAEWVRAVAHLSDDVGAPASEWVLEGGGFR
jgi:hypothetical protein